MDGLVITTERLLLRELTVADIGIVAAMLCDPEVMRHWPRPMTLPEAEAWIQTMRQRYAKDGCGYWLALDRSSGDVVGQAGVIIQTIDGEELPGLGYMLIPAYRGRGFATEAARACCGYVFHRMAGRFVHALIRPENTESTYVAQRLGMQKTGTTIYAGLVHTKWSLACSSTAGTRTATP